MLEALRRHCILEPGIEALEIGTGWVHWEALMLRNEVDCRIQLYDIIDNRRSSRMRKYLLNLTRPEVRERLQLTDNEAAFLMNSAAKTRRSEDLYDLLGFEYLVDAEGQMKSLPEKAFDLLVSSDVGEHLKVEHVPEILCRWFEVTRPGGYGYHLIILADHLTIYAKDAHPKQYLMYDRADFLDRINNDVQYINTLQPSELRAALQNAGFEVLEMNPVGICDLSEITVHPSWRKFDQADLETTALQAIVRRPIEN